MPCTGAVVAIGLVLGFGLPIVAADMLVTSGHRRWQTDERPRQAYRYLGGTVMAR